MSPSSGSLNDFVDVNLFRLCLRGAFDNWRGDYNVLLADSGEYFPLQQGEKSAVLLYNEVRKSRTGNETLLKDDIRIARQSLRERRQISFTDYVGLTSIATPIVIDNTELAVVFSCGIVPKDEETRDVFRMRVSEIETQLGLSHRKLRDIARKIPAMSDETIRETSERVRQVIEYIARTGFERKELIDLRAKQAKYLSLSDKLLTTNNVFRTTTRNINSFVSEHVNASTLSYGQYWTKVNEILETFLAFIDASYLFVLIPTLTVPKQYRVVSVAGAPIDYFGASYEIPEKSQVTTSTPLLYRGNFDSLALELRKHNTKREAEIDVGLVSQIQLDIENIGLLVALFDRGHRTKKTFENSEEASILELLATVLSSSFQTLSANEALNKEFLNRENETKEKLIWMEKITHQLMAPFTGIEGAAGLLLMHYEKWQNEHPQMFQGWSEGEQDTFRNRLNDIVWTTTNAALIVDNLAWRVGRRNGSNSSEFVDDVARWLIETVRDYQGIASLRHIKVNVDTNNSQPLNSRIKVDADFRQAIGNIIDNAVKYSIGGSTIVVKAFPRNDEAVIEITNLGIKLEESEIPKIFQYSYRAPEAQKKNAPGTGIGLSIAKDIVKANGGRIEAYPSEKSGVHWQTTFAIVLPLANIGQKK